MATREVARSEDGRLGILDRILVTPSNHRVHHGQNDYCIDKNMVDIKELQSLIKGIQDLDEINEWGATPAPPEVESVSGAAAAGAAPGRGWLFVLSGSSVAWAYPSF